MDEQYYNQNQGAPAPAVPTEAPAEDEEDVEDLAIEAHERLNALISVLLKKGVFTEEEIEFEAFRQAQEE